MPRAGVTPEAIANAAATIADAEGLKAVTLVRLADHFGVRPPSLYKHVDGLDAIHARLALMALREANARMARAAIGKARDAALFALAHAYWQFARERPGLYAAALRPGDPGDRELAVAGEAMVGTLQTVLAGYGLSSDDTRHATRGLRAIIHGFASLDAGGAFRLRSDLTESFDRLLRGFANGLAERAGSYQR